MASSLPAPGRRDRQKFSRRLRILRAARRLFARRGFSQTAMEDVADSAKLAVGTIYNYFPSKTDLLLAIIGRETGSLLERGRALAGNPPDSPLAAMTALTELFVGDLLKGDRRLWRELFAAAITDPRSIGARMFEADRQLIALLAELIADFKQRGALAETLDETRAATVVYSVCFSLLTAYLIDDRMEPETIRSEIRRGIAIVLDGMRPSDPSGGELP